MDGDAPSGDELAPGAAGGGRKRSGPAVLPDQHAGHSPRLHRRGEVGHVFFRKKFGELSLGGPELVHLVKVVNFQGFDAAVFRLVQDKQVQYSNQLGVHQPADLTRHFASEIGSSWRELDHQIVDGPVR